MARSARSMASRHERCALPHVMSGTRASEHRVRHRLDLALDLVELAAVRLEELVGRGLAALEQRRGHAHDAGPRLLAVLVELAPPVVRRVEAAEARPRELLLGPVGALDGYDLCGNQNITAPSC